MLLIDANILIYAVNRHTPLHTAARNWWESQLGTSQELALVPVVVLAFLRIATHPRAMAEPLPPEEALAKMEVWLSHANVRALSPGPRHWRIIGSLLRQVGTAGNLTTDAHLAALAIEHDCVLCSSDRDFDRFPGLNWRNPLAPRS